MEEGEPQNLKTQINYILEAGCLLTIKREIFSENGRIIFRKNQVVEVEEVLKYSGFWGKMSGQWYDEKIYAVKLKGYINEWYLSTFVETSAK